MTQQEHTDGQVYRVGDVAFQAAGGLEGIRRLIDCFYQLMDERPETATIRRIHADDLTESREKLTLFLCGYLNGPELFERKYGPIRLPAAHRHLAIGTQERHAWLACMKSAIDKQPYEEAFKAHLFARLWVTAERVRNRQ
ncbi:MAG: group II truncated hemoglobin [Planctomycetes bacterium]|nr:group II truncated hemoglobin [Planctomycetota bacterium]